MQINFYHVAITIVAWEKNFQGLREFQKCIKYFPKLITYRCLSCYFAELSFPTLCMSEFTSFTVYINTTCNHELNKSSYTFVASYY